MGCSKGGARRESLLLERSRPNCKYGMESLVQNASTKCGLLAGSDPEFRGSTEHFDTDETGNVSRGSAMNGAHVSVKKHDEAR